MQAVILCGGLGTRMAGVAPDLPKVLLPVAGVPFLRRLLARIERSGIEDVLLCVGHRAEAVDEELRKNPPPVRVRLANDGERLLGTAGALRAALPELEDAFLVTYGDSYLTFDYAAPLRQLLSNPGADGCLAVYENRDAIEPSNTAVAGGLVVRYEKARTPGSPRLDHIDYGATALRRSVVEALPASTPVGLDVVQAQLAAAGRLLALPVSDRFYEVGSPSGLADLEAYLSRKDLEDV